MLRKNKKTKTKKISGLTSFEARTRLLKYGENTVFKKRKFRPFLIFLKKFNSPLLLMLIGASLVSFFLGEHISSIILLLMVLISGILDFVNTFHSEATVAKLIARVVTTATVIRDGKRKEIKLAKIVPGDILFLSAGDVVPADCELLESNDLFVGQSSLTGESLPIEKNAVIDIKGDSASIFENKKLVFMGTNIITGYGKAVVINTGVHTEFGKIADRLSEEDGETDFEKGIKKFSYLILRMSIVLIGLVFLFNALNGRGWLMSFIFGLSIAIGITPELLPVIISVCLSRGSVRMADKQVIVKNLSAIQNFGSMNILCTDKTGTLTKDHITLVKYLDGFGHESESTLLYAYLNSSYHTGIQNPLDNAIKEFKKIEISKYKKIAEIPFDFERRRQSVVVKSKNELLFITKGAPEEVFPICDFCLVNGKKEKFAGINKIKIKAQFDKLSRDGFKVLGLATKNLEKQKGSYSFHQENAMTFCGFVAFLDPPKESAIETINDLKNLGVEIKILTGDNPLLTERICLEIKLPIKGVVTGDQLAKMNDSQLLKAALNNTIFARLDPEQKQKIILSLRKNNQVVGYLGDGINDAMALKSADVGLSVNNAVDIAKETADIILLKKSLDVLKDGIIEGRRTFSNTMKYVMMGLSSNFGNMFSMMGGSLFLPFLPMTPPQILFNNFLYDASQLSIPTDQVDDEDLRKPTSWDLGLIKKYMLVFGLVSSLFDFVTFGVLYGLFGLQKGFFRPVGFCLLLPLKFL